jgi:hypothetical protein
MVVTETMCINGLMKIKLLTNQQVSAINLIAVIMLKYRFKKNVVLRQNNNDFTTKKLTTLINPINQVILLQ